MEEQARFNLSMMKMKKPPAHPSSTGGFSEKKGLLKQRKRSYE